jgi:EmrB/QacA subfamily drug resistance transporter
MFQAKQKLIITQPTLFSVALAFAMVYPDGSVLSVALPAMQKSFNVSSAYLLWIINIYTLMRALLVFASGKISDIFSHRKMFILSIMIFTLASIGCATMSSFYMLVLFRGIQGIGSAIVLTSGMSLVTILVPTKQRGQIISQVLTVGLASMAVAPVISGIIIEYTSWHWIFYISAILGAVSISFAISTSSEPELSSPSEKFDWTGFFLSGIFTLFTTIGFNNSNIWGWTSFNFIICIMMSFFAFIFFLFVELRKKNPLIDLILFTLPSFTALMIIAAFTQIALLVILFMGIFLQNALGFSALVAGFLLLPMIIAGLFFSNISGYLVDNFGAKIPIVSGNGLTILGFILTIVLFNNISYLALLPLLLFSGSGLFMILGPVRTAALENIPKEKHGMVNGILNGIRAISSVIGFSVLSSIMTNVEYLQAKMRLIKVLPTISGAQVQSLLNLHFNSPQSETLLSNYSVQVQESIRNIVLISYENCFFWVLIFLLLLITINFLLGIFFIKKNINLEINIFAMENYYDKKNNSSISSKTNS